MFLPKFNLWHPERFLGAGRSKTYFEGWYFKLVSLSGESLAIIPGLAIDQAGKKEIFIQLLNGADSSSRYFIFEKTQAEFSSFDFSVKIANNYFSQNELVLDLPEVSGRLSFSDNNFWPRFILSPGIMGPFSFLPFLECRHDIINLLGKINGQLTVGGRQIDFTGGTVYLEKDWGHSFPSAYLWLQSSNFTEAGSSFMLSVAQVPWLGFNFTGLIGCLLFKGRLYKFSTYNLTKLSKLKVSSDSVEVAMENRQYSLSVFIKRQPAGKLAAPRGGLMTDQIEESLKAVCEVKLFDRRNNKIIFQSPGSSTALEIAGRIDDLCL